jgi:hypothetical protein
MPLAVRSLAYVMSRGAPETISIEQRYHFTGTTSAGSCREDDFNG